MTALAIRPVSFAEPKPTPVPKEVFVAKWDATNQHLKKPEMTTFRKVMQVFWLIISIIIFPIGIARLIGIPVRKYAIEGFFPRNPAKETSEQLEQRQKKERDFEKFWKGVPDPREKEDIRLTFTAQQFTVMTPDGVKLNAIFFRHKNAVETTLTTISFAPLGGDSLEEETPWIIEEAAKRRVVHNLVTCDYRRVGERTSDLIIDGSSIVQFVRDRLKTPASKIGFYGFSLGGAVAAHTQALDKTLTGPAVYDRTFDSVSKMVPTFIDLLAEHKPSFFIRAVLKLRGCIGGILSCAVKAQGFDLNPGAQLKKVAGKKLVIYHPGDRTIVEKASLHHSAAESEKLKLVLEDGYVNRAKQDGHGLDLNMHVGAMDRFASHLLV